MNAQQIADLLRNQAAQAPHQVRLNDAALGILGLDARVRDDLLRPDGVLILEVDPADIPQTPPAGGFTLDARVPAGLDGFLALDGRDAEVQFSVNGTVGVRLAVKTRMSGGAAAAWAFSDSFPELAYRPYDELTLAEPRLELSTGGTGLPAAGLSLSAGLKLEGLFATLAGFAGVSVPTQRLSGTLARGPLGLGFDFRAPLGIASKSLGSLLEMEDLHVGVALIPFRSGAGFVDRLVHLYLGATVTVAGTSLDMQVAVPITDPESQTLLFSIHPTKEVGVTLSSLGSMVSNQTWSGFFTGPAAALLQKFDNFVLRGYSTTFSLSGARPVSIVVHAGTTSPWDFLPGYSLTLEATWQILFLSATQTVSTLSLSSVFTFKSIQFDVEVILPELSITGSQRGELVTLSLDQLNTRLFDGALPIPDGLASVSVSNLSIDIDVPQKRFGIGATASASVALFGTPLLAIRDMDIGVTIDASGTANTYTARLSGQVTLGTIAVYADATISNAADTVFSLHLVDETVGSMLGRLVHLVDPTWDVSLGTPWDRFLAIRLDALVLEVNVTDGTVGLSYNASVDLEFAQLDRLRLEYKRAKDGKPAGVRIEVEGTFLGEGYGAGRDHPALGWDAINDAPPAVPGGGDLLLDLRYLGLGQHVGFATAPAATLRGVMQALQDTVVPREPGQLPALGTAGGLQFREESDWLIGVDVSVLGTVSVSAIFNDPDLYGILISLSGARAGRLAGLSFELLYRKVTDTIGVYHVELKLPDAMRIIQMGAATLTLPVVVVDVYTNGNFRIDLGFPVGLDFSRSFSLNVGTLVGRGGLYFASLDGATSTRVPAISNGTWSPVLEFGLALSVGVGRTVNAGILTGSVSLEVVGILHGVVAWFNPTDGSPEETYHWIQGTVAVVGRLYAVIDFAILQASVDVTAFAAVTVTIESHQPIYIALSAGVSVQVSVTILLFTFDLSFSTTVEASVTIGEASPTPWKLGPGAAAASAGLRALADGSALQTMSLGVRQAQMLDAALFAGAPAAWPAARVLPGARRTIPVWAMPSFTKPDTWSLATASRAGGTATFATATPHDLLEGDAVVIAGVADASFDGTWTVDTSPTDRAFTVLQSGADGTSTGGRVTLAGAPATAAAVLLLAVENSVAPRAATPAERRVPAGADPASAPFNLLMQAMLGWGIHVETAWSVASAARAADVVTVTTDGPHRLSPGDTVLLSGGDDASFRGAFAVLATPAADTFTVAQAGVDAASAGGTARYVAAAVPVTSAARAGGTVTVTTPAPHGLAAGEAVRMEGAADASFDGLHTVATAADATTFTFAQAGDDGTSTGGWAAAPGVTAAQLADLRAMLQDPATSAAAFDYATLAAFLAENFTFQVAASDAATAEAGVALFPMPPAVTLTDTAGTTVDFAAHAPVGETYRRKVRAYFRLLQEQFQSREEGDGAAAADAADEVPVSMATVVFSQYFAMLASAGARAALDLLAKLPFTTPRAMGIAEIGEALGDGTLAVDPLRVVAPNRGAAVLHPGAVFSLTVRRPVRTGETFASIAQALQTAGALNGGGTSYSAGDLVVSNASAKGIFTPGVELTFLALSWTTVAGDTLNRISVRILLRASGTATLNALTGLQAATEALRAANPAFTDPEQVLPPGTVLAIPGGTYTTVAGDTLNGIAAAQGAVDVAAYVASLKALNSGLTVTDATAAQPAGVVLTLPPGTYTTVSGDTLTWVAAYGVAAAQGAFDTATFVADLLVLNPGLAVKDPARAQPVGTVMTLPPVTRVLTSADSLIRLENALLTTTEMVEAALLALPASAGLLSPRATLNAPLLYAATATDTFASIAATFGLTLQEVADAAAWAGPVFAAGKTITVAAVPALRVSALDAALAATAEWNNASGMVSRFLLSGLRLPHPDDPAFAGLTEAQLLDPVNLAGIVTRPLFGLTGQQYPIAAPAPDGYTVTLTNAAGAPWLDLGETGALSFALTAEQRAMLETVAGTPLDPPVASAGRLPLFRMVPARTALRNPVAWHAAARPLECGSTAVNPALWMFPESLQRQARAAAEAGVDFLQELVAAPRADAGMSGPAAEAACYRWATRVDFTVSLPAAEGAAPAAAGAVVVAGADDAGAALLHDLHVYLDGQPDADPSVYLLCPPDPAAGSTGELVSDVLDPARTFLLRTNLSPLTQSGAGDDAFLAFDAHDEAEVNAAPLSDAAGFVGLLWEASITRSGGFYLNYATSSDGAGLPPEAFGTGTTATLSLLVMLDPVEVVGMPAFHNCVVVGDAIDPATTTLLVQPATYAVQRGDSLTDAADAFNEDWGMGYTAAEVAGFNGSVPLLLLPGAVLAIPAGGGTHTVAPGDTLAGIAAAHATTVAELAAAGENLTKPILTPGALMQLAQGGLERRATAPQGIVGFEVSRDNPDPDNLSYAEMSPAQVVESLFNLLGWTLNGGTAFHPSGAGLPTTPADRPGAEGPSAQGDDETAEEWYYPQTLSAASFARVHRGSASPALPPAAANPYNGVGFATAANLDLQDVYGNLQPVPAGRTPIPLPVGYVDDVAGLSSWPSTAVTYTVTGPSPVVALSMSFQQARYVPAPAAPVDAALAAIRNDLAAWRRIHYQLSQPDVELGLETTLDKQSLQLTGRYFLPREPFAAFARGAWVYLSALATLQPVVVAGDGTTTVATLTAAYGLTAAQLFAANAAQPYAALFGAATLAVPRMYPVLQGDTPASIAAGAASPAPTVSQIAQWNAAVPLRAGADLTAPARTATALATDSFATLAKRTHASVEGIAAGNAATAGLLAAGASLAWGTASYAVKAGDTLNTAAAALGATAAQLAAANQHTAGIFVPGAALRVAGVLAAEGDTLASLAALLGSDVPTLAGANAATANLWAPATPLYLGTHPTPVAPGPGDTLGTFATANGVTPEQLGTENPARAFAAGAPVSIPGALARTPGATTYATYTARAGDTLGGIAGRFGAQPAELAALNPDLPGLLLPGQRVVHAATLKSVVTNAGETFHSLAARFGEIGVTVQPAALAADVAAQAELVKAGGLWITPPMRGDGGGSNTTRTLAGLAAAYGTDVATLAAANAATPGLIAAGVELTVGSVKVTTGAQETLNALAGRVGKSVAAAAQALAHVPGLVPAAAPVLPLPPPSPPELSVSLVASFAAPVFPLTMNLYAWRNPAWIHPDFAGVGSVAQAVAPVAPQPDSGGTLAFTGFAAGLQAALPGLHLATGAGDGDGSAAAASFWCVNFGSDAGDAIEWEVDGAGTVTFALPPLSTSLMGGTVNVKPYESGTGLGTAAQPRVFQGVDLDVWLNAFLEAVDRFLAPAHAVPAFAADAAAVASRAVVRVVEDKRALAQALAARVQRVLQGDGGSLDDARTAMEHALLARLSSAFTVSALVQVPVTVTGGADTALSAPRLSGRLAATGAGAGTEGRPGAFTFSTAKVPLVEDATATFLFTVRSPADHRQAHLDLRYVVNELEVPDPDAVSGDYQGSSWLSFVLPLDEANGAIGEVDIPVPLRAYPGPVTLAAQAARQSAEAPASAAQLLGWDFGFVYGHDEAAQDTPTVVVAFNGAPAGPVAGAANDPLLTAVFEALAQFMAVYPALREDLALLPLVDPASADPVTAAAVQAFATLVHGVADAFTALTAQDLFVPAVESYAYRLQKEQGDTGELTRLRVTSVDPLTGTAKANPVALWPDVYVTRAGVETALMKEGTPTATEAKYLYPAGIAAGAELPQRLVFAWPGSAASTQLAPWPPAPPDAPLPAPQTYTFTGIDPLRRQSGRAGVSLARNLTLVQGSVTAPAFVYRTPLTAFPSAAAPSVLGDAPISLGAAPTAIAQALGAFLKTLFTSRGTWNPEDQVEVRLAVAYVYPVAEEGLPVRVPVLLVPGFAFAPAADWEWTKTGSFVSQVQAGIAAWEAGKTLRAEGSYVFDLTVYASEGLLQPLIRATALQYALAPP